MKLTFEQKIDFIFAEFFLSHSYQKLANKHYYYKKVNGIQTNFYIAQIDDNKPNDHHQRFDIDIGLYSDYSNSVMTSIPEEYPESHNNFAFDRISDHSNFLPAVLAFKSNSNLNTLKQKYLAALQPFMQAFNGINHHDDAIDVCLNNLRFGRLDAYLYRTKDKPRYEKWYRKNYFDEIKAGSFSEENIIINCQLAMRTNREKQMANFAPNIDFPEILGKICDWVDDMNYYEWISGGVELSDSGKETMGYWIIDENVSNKLAVFAEAESGNVLIMAWKKDDGSMPIVTIGEGGVAKVIAASMEDFIDLLAIGYCDLSDDLTIAPAFENEDRKLFRNNDKFKAFYLKTFNKPILKTGKHIVENAKNCGNFRDWLISVYPPWVEMG